MLASGNIPTEERLGGRRYWRLDGPHGGRTPGALSKPMVEDLAAVGALVATVRWLRGTDGAGVAAVRVAAGTLRAGERERPVCRVTLEGDAAAAYALAQALSGTLRLAPPRLSLAGEAAELGGLVVAPLHLGAPVLPADGSVEAALATLVAQLAAVLLHWAPLAGPDAGGEPVHQLRVALRRLRSGLKLFEPLAGCPRLEVAQDALRALGRTLGAARDWDVFLGGLGCQVAAAFPGERAVPAMLRAAKRQRRAAYGAVLADLHGPAFRSLCLVLAELAETRPWRGWTPENPAIAGERAAALQQDVASFGCAALDRRLRGVLRAGRGFNRRSAAELHALRIECKRLRYACELFAPCFPESGAPRFMRRLAALQERLGVLNDAATAEALMQRVGRGLAAGLVRGFAAAREAEARAEAGRGWKRFRRCRGFW